MLTMPKELQQVIHASRGGPVRLTDPETMAEYVILSSEIYEQLLYDDVPLTTDEQQDLLIQAGLRAGWDESEMDIYNNLDPRKELYETRYA